MGSAFLSDQNLRTIKMRKIMLLLVLVSLIAIATAYDNRRRRVPGSRRRSSSGSSYSTGSSSSGASRRRRRTIPRKRSIQDEGEDIAAFLEEQANMQAETDIEDLEKMFHDLVDEVHDE